MTKFGLVVILGLNLCVAATACLFVNVINDPERAYVGVVTKVDNDTVYVQYENPDVGTRSYRLAKAQGIAYTPGATVSISYRDSFVYGPSPNGILVMIYTAASFFLFYLTAFWSRRKRS